jgi:tRNA (adenine22-N1)-methyltransferase
MASRKLALSERLRTITEMVTPGHRVCDVGCDHAFVAIHLVEEETAPSAIVIDVNPGPLDIARQHINEHGLNDKIEIRLSDGLAAYEEGEAETVIITGMGGYLIQDILDADFDKTLSIKEIILGPQSDLPTLRYYLRQNGLKIIDEMLVLEYGKFYPLLKVRATGVVHGGSAMTLADHYGPILLTKRDPLMLKYLEREHGLVMKAIEDLNNNIRYHTERSRRKLAELTARAKELEGLGVESD